MLPTFRWSRHGVMPLKFGCLESFSNLCRLFKTIQSNQHQGSKLPTFFRQLSQTRKPLPKWEDPSSNKVLCLVSLFNWSTTIHWWHLQHVSKTYKVTCILFIVFQPWHPYLHPKANHTNNPPQQIVVLPSWTSM